MVDRSQSAFLRKLSNRLTSVERRLGRGAFNLPPRLTTTGAEVTDWNDAIAPGFYWASASAAHAPGAFPAAGTVEVQDMGLVVLQTVRRADTIQPLALSTSYIRRRASDGSWSPWSALRPAGYGQIPTSVSIGSGSASVDDEGLVTFTAASSLSLNGVFDGLGADVYSVILRATGSAAAVVGTRLRVAGVDFSGASYNYAGNWTNNSAGPTRYSTFGATQFGFWNPIVPPAGPEIRGLMTLYNPNKAGATWYTMASYLGASNRWLVSEGGDVGNGASDGLTIFPASGTITGNLKVVKIA